MSRASQLSVGRRAALALYRAALRLTPASMRNAHGEEMLELCADELRAARGLGILRVLIRALVDIAVRSPHEHWRRRGRPAMQRLREPMVRSFVSDFRYALRSFGRQPAATALVVGTLALAVAANTAVFALVDAVFFRALPYPHASRLVDLNERAPAWNLEFTGINYPDFATWQRTARTFEAMALWEDAGFNLADDNGSVRVDGQFVTYDMPRTLGIAPILGRSFTAAEDVPNGPNVVMISRELWQTRFAGSNDVIGKTLRIGSVPYTIIGVLPSNVLLDAPTTLWVPMRGDPKQSYQSFSYEGVGRLRPGVTIEQARSDLDMAQQPIWHARDSLRLVSPRMMPLRDRFVAEYRATGAALGVGVVLVLLIACANVAGTMLARSVVRRREVAIRSALGASDARLRRQLLTESLALAMAGGILGTMVGRAGIGLLVAGMDEPPPWLHLSLDARAIAFSVLIVLVTTVLFGLAPSLRLRRQTRGTALVGGGVRASSSRAERRLLDTLVVAEIALAAVLLASGGLLMRAYMNLRSVDPGFRADGVATFRVSLPEPKYHNGLVQRHFYESLVERIAALPGVTSAGAITCAPFGCHWGVILAPAGAAPKRPGEGDPIVLARVATPNYFAAMGIRLIRGRFFAEHEGAAQGPRPAVINEELLKQLWPTGDDPIGKRFTFRGSKDPHDSMTVVGVVHDARHYGLAQPMRPGFYLSMTALDSTDSFQRYSVVAHTSGDPNSLFAPMRAIVHELDPELPMFDVKTLQTALNQSTASRRVIALWLVTFAAVALVLAIGGIYAMLSYVVGRRRHEIGIRMALGARAGQVLRVIVGQGLRLVTIGLAIGVPAALLTTKALSSLLIGVTPRDPITYVAVSVVLLITGGVAALIPARRAATVDPKVALTDGGS